MLASARRTISNLAFSPALGSRLHFTPAQSFGSEKKFVKFDYTDALNIQSLLTEEEIMVYFNS